MGQRVCGVSVCARTHAGGHGVAEIVEIQSEFFCPLSEEHRTTGDPQSVGYCITELACTLFGA